MKKRLVYKKYKQELRKAMEDEIDGVYLTKKMVKKMSIKEMDSYFFQKMKEYIGY